MTSIIQNLQRIEERGASGHWRWIKYADGTADVWGWFDSSTPANGWTGWGSLFYGTVIPSSSYPVAFTETPYVIASVAKASTDIWITVGNGTQTTSPRFYPMAVQKHTVQVTHAIAVHAHGRWK